MTAADTLALLDWKRRVFALYEAVRTMEPEEAWALWRETRDELFRSHPQSPLPVEARGGFEGLEYWPYDPEARVLADLEDVEAPPQPIETSPKTASPPISACLEAKRRAKGITAIAVTISARL